MNVTLCNRKADPNTLGLQREFLLLCSQVRNQEQCWTTTPWIMNYTVKKTNVHLKYGRYKNRLCWLNPACKRDQKGEALDSRHAIYLQDQFHLMRPLDHSDVLVLIVCDLTMDSRWPYKNIWKEKAQEKVTHGFGHYQNSIHCWPPHP